MSKQITKNPKGHCPYCLDGNSETDVHIEALPHPQKEILFCVPCDKYFSLVVHRGITYPLVDPSDPKSSPVVSSRV